MAERDMFEMLAALAASRSQSQPGEKRAPVIEPLSLEGIVKKISEFRNLDKKRRIIVMTGAGISTAAGIPDFRTPGTGLYDNLQKYNLPTPQAVFEIGYFKHNPLPFYHLAKELYPAQFKPTLSHYFIRLLEEEGLLLRAFTQNIDTLERRAGIPDERIVEAHGAFNTAHCTTCGKSYPSDLLKEKVFRGELPLCEEKGCAYVPPDDSKEVEPYQGLIKPDIVFFGESLPDRFSKCVMEDFPNCELLIIMGTSLKVQPFAGLVSRVSSNCPRLLINLERVGEMDPIMSMLMGGGGGLDFDEETAYRDVFLQDTCDNGCKQLAQLLGLEDKLTQLHEEEHRRLDGEISAMNAEMAALSLEDKPDVTETTPPNPSTETSVDQLTSEPMDGHDQPLPSTSNDLSPPTAGTDQTGADMSMGHPKTSPAVTTTYVDKPTGDCDGEEDTN